MDEAYAAVWNVGSLVQQLMALCPGLQTVKLIVWCCVFSTTVKIIYHGAE